MDKQITVEGRTFTIRVGDDGIADLTRPSRPPIPVRIGGDVFQFAGEAPGDMARIIGQLQDGDESSQVKGMLDFLDLVMMAGSKERFTARMGAADDPITFDHLQDLFVYLSDKYMGDDRPTVPGSSSADGSQPGGVTLTGTPQNAASTPSLSLSQDY